MFLNSIFLPMPALNFFANKKHIKVKAAFSKKSLNDYHN